VVLDADRREAPSRREEYALRRELRDTLTGLIRAGQRAGIFRAGDADALATIVFATLDPALARGATDTDGLKHRQRMSG
jgi:hypothetical protein